MSTSSSTQAVSSDVAELKDMVRALILDRKNQNLSFRPRKAVETKLCELVGEAAAANFNQANSGYRPPMVSNQIRPPVVSLPSKDESSSNHDTEVTKGHGVFLLIRKHQRVRLLLFKFSPRNPNPEPNVAPVVTPVPKASIPFPSRRNDERRKEKANDQIEKFYEIFRDLSFEISFTDALMLMPKFASTLKTLIGNKEKLSELARTPLNENCSAVILNKLPKKLGDPGRFLIPCEFTGITTCNALADLGASINLMPYSVWKDLALPELTPTCMTLELADRSITEPIGIAEDVFVNVGKFQFPADFVVVDFEPDPRVPLILGRCFLKTSHALIDVYEGEITLRVGKEAITFNLDQTSKYTADYNHMTVNKIDVIDMACDEYSQEIQLTKRSRKKSTFTAHTELLPIVALPFGLCMLPGTFQRCMMAIFHDMIEKTMEVFMDDFSVFGDSFSTCLSHLEKMLSGGEDTSLSLKWGKSPFYGEGGMFSDTKFLNRDLRLIEALGDILKACHVVDLTGGHYYGANYTARKDFPDCEDSRACSIPQEFHILSFSLGIQKGGLGGGFFNLRHLSLANIRKKGARLDGSSKNYKIFSEMLDDFDRQDVLDLHRLVKASWKLFDSCGIHILLMDNGIAIHMMIEKKYPLTQEMLSKMLSRKLKVDHENEMTFELLRISSRGMDSFQRLTLKSPSSWHRSLASNLNFYDLVSIHLKCEIDRAGGGKLCDKNAKEFWEIIENLALYDHEGFNDSKDRIKPVKAVAVSSNASKTPDRRLLEFEDQINFWFKGSQPTPKTSSTHTPQAYAKAVSLSPLP
ncbi:reverse transcriptase domain-containing protein [Tanacetum coccineum]|uniref:Reverse transcriptase domain-containing protein n=1 Tax=Tanacetum coccineum TaxID=301880 RepID=A0ABQ5H802_9ASTR